MIARHETKYKHPGGPFNSWSHPDGSRLEGLLEVVSESKPSRTCHSRTCRCPVCGEPSLIVQDDYQYPVKVNVWCAEGCPKGDINSAINDLWVARERRRRAGRESASEHTTPSPEPREHPAQVSQAPSTRSGRVRPRGKRSGKSSGKGSSKGFTKVPNVVLDEHLRERRIGLFAFTLYLRLVRMAGSKGECWPSISHLVKLTGYSKSYVVEALAELEEVGLIEILTGAESSRKSNTYLICDVSGDVSGGRTAGVRQAFGGASGAPEGVRNSGHHLSAIVDTTVRTQKRPESQEDTEEPPY